MQDTNFRSLIASPRLLRPIKRVYKLSSKMAMRQWQNITSYSNSEIPNSEAYIPRKLRNYICSSSEKNWAKKWLVVYTLGSSSCPTPVCEGRRRRFSRKNSLFFANRFPSPTSRSQSRPFFDGEKITKIRCNLIRMPKAH